MKNRILSVLLILFWQVLPLLMPQLSYAASAGGGSTSTSTGTSTSTSSNASSSNCVFTIIGTLPAGLTPTMPEGCSQTGSFSNNKMVQLATDLVNSIISACPPIGVVSSDHLNCIVNMTIPSSATFPAAVKSHILTSAAPWQDEYGIWHTGYFQCVGFVNAVTAGIYDPNGLMETSALGKAADYINSNISGYTYMDNTNPIQEGDMPLWNADASNEFSGHIAIVIQVVDPVRGVFDVAQANWGTPGSVSFRKSVTIDEIAGWLRKT